jgi:hypothetical protein
MGVYIVCRFFHSLLITPRMGICYTKLYYIILYNILLYYIYPYTYTHIHLILYTPYTLLFSLHPKHYYTLYTLFTRILLLYRSVGDPLGPRACLPLPDITAITIPPHTHARFVIASDGMWDVVSSEEVRRIGLLLTMKSPQVFNPHHLYFNMHITPYMLLYLLNPLLH